MKKLNKDKGLPFSEARSSDSFAPRGILSPPWSCSNTGICLALLLMCVYLLDLSTSIYITLGASASKGTSFGILAAFFKPSSVRVSPCRLRREPCCRLRYKISWMGEWYHLLLLHLQTGRNQKKNSTRRIIKINQCNPFDRGYEVTTVHRQPGGSAIPKA